MSRDLKEVGESTKKASGVRQFRAEGHSWGLNPGAFLACSAQQAMPTPMARENPQARRGRGLREKPLAGPRLSRATRSSGGQTEGTNRGCYISESWNGQCTGTQGVKGWAKSLLRIEVVGWFKQSICSHDCSQG